MKESGRAGSREAAPEESRKLRLRTSVRSASERYGTGLERSRRLLQRESTNAGKGRQGTKRTGVRKEQRRENRKKSRGPSMTGSKTTKEYQGTRKENGIGRSEYTRHSSLSKCTLGMQPVQCNEHGYVLADALNSHSGRAITYETLTTADPYRAPVLNAREYYNVYLVLLKQKSLFLHEEQTIPDCTVRFKYIPPISALIRFCDCGIYLKAPHCEMFALRSI